MCFLVLNSFLLSSQMLPLAYLLIFENLTCSFLILTYSSLLAFLPRLLLKSVKSRSVGGGGIFFPRETPSPPAAQM